MKSLSRIAIIVQKVVALFTRAWIEIVEKIGKDFGTKRRPLHEGVD